MPGDIQKRKLLVISDTPVYKEGEKYIAFEPVVRELEVLAGLFDEIVWLACKVNERKHAMRAPGSGSGIKIVGMPSVTNGRLNTLAVLVRYLVFLFYIFKNIRRSDLVHTRGPSHPAFLGSLYSLFDRSRGYWHKYAGNWIGQNLSFSYRIQRRLLMFSGDRKRKVTVNGKWSGNPRHILSFENPCISDDEREHAKKIQLRKDYHEGLNLLFVGNLTEAKGILELMDAIIAPGFPPVIRTVFIAGDGELKEQVLQKAGKITNCDVQIKGFMNREEINRLYEVAHIIILPSKSEGFPKVIAEGAAYGCIPVATNVSALSQYITDRQNGFLLENNSASNIVATLQRIVQHPSLQDVGNNAVQMSAKFTYEHFIERVKNEIIG